MSRRTSYGIDAPVVPFGLASGGVILLVIAILNAVLDVGRWAVLGPVLGSVMLLGGAGVYLHTTLRGKFRIWSGLLEGVADRVELHTGDMTALEFPDGTFDVVLSSLAIHNIGSAEGRQQAVDEAARVLRPGGRLVIADIMHAADYAQRLTNLGLSDVAHRRLGWYWYGGP